MAQKIMIFGATGMTGLCSLDAAIKQDENKVPEDVKSKVDIVVGNVLNAEQVLNAVEGVNSVVVVLGTRNDLSPTTDLSNGMKNIIAAMKAHNVETVTVCLSAFLFLEPDKIPQKYVEITNEHRRMYEALETSSLKYVAVCPPHIGDAPSSKFIVEIGKSPGRVISKWDLGKFLVDALSQKDYYGKKVGLANVA